MQSVPRTLISRLVAFSAMLCMVAVVMAGFESGHSALQILEHQVAGDQQLADGGWAATCSDKDGQCVGHLGTGETSTNDLVTIHHHHHNSSEVPQGLAVRSQNDSISLALTQVKFVPAQASPLADLWADLPFQPPRV